MLTSMIGRNIPRPRLPSGAPPANMPGSGGIHKMIAQALQTQPQVSPMAPPQGMQMPQSPPPMMNPRNAMMGKILRG